MDNPQKIIQAITEAGKPLKGGEIAELTGLDKKNVDKAIKELKKDEKIMSPKRCYYDLCK